MKKQQELEFALHDNGDTVKVLLADGEKILLDYEHEKIKAVRVRAPIVTKEQVNEIANQMMSIKPGWNSFEECIEQFITWREQEISEQVQEIRKCLKRIKQYSLSARNAKEALNEHHG